MTSVSTTVTFAIDARGVARIALNRPDVHNAFDEGMIAEVTAAARQAASDDRVRVVLLSGNGKSFSAGADLSWMRRAASFTHEENQADALRLAAMFEAIDTMPKPTVARLHGNVFAGATGIVAACDIAVAAEGTTFALSEVRLGLVPATISPYILRAMGERNARRVFLTAERFDAVEARAMGLVHRVVPGAELDRAIEGVLDQLLACSVDAQAATKRLVRSVAGRVIDREVIAETARAIADARLSPQGREGIASFLERRPPSWLTAPGGSTKS